jgi:hypothetical protein
MFLPRVSLRLVPGWLVVLAASSSLVFFGSSLRVPSGSHSRILLGSLFSGILFTCTSNFNSFSSVISHIFLSTSIVAQIVSFRAFPSPGFLTDLLQKSISFGSSSIACCVFSVHVSATHNRLLRTEAL